MKKQAIIILCVILFFISITNDRYYIESLVLSAQTTTSEIQRPTLSVDTDVIISEETIGQKTERMNGIITRRQSRGIENRLVAVYLLALCVILSHYFKLYWVLYYLRHCPVKSILMFTVEYIQNSDGKKGRKFVQS